MAFSITDTLWVFLAAILVFFMNLGFASVEAGFARAKNTVNILSKNFIVFAVSSLGFLLLGWGLMFGGENPFVQYGAGAGIMQQCFFYYAQSHKAETVLDRTG